MDFPLITFVKALYPTYSHYFESLQASEKLKDISLYSLVEKFAERVKYFRKKKTISMDMMLPHVSFLVKS